MQQSASCRERAGSAHLRNGPLKSGHDFSVQYWLSAEPSPEGNLTLWAFPAAHCSSLPPCITALSPPSVVLVDKTGFSFQRALLPTNSWALGAQVHFTTWHLTWKDTFPHIKAYRISISRKPTGTHWLCSSLWLSLSIIHSIRFWVQNIFFTKLLNTHALNWPQWHLCNSPSQVGLPTLSGFQSSTFYFSLFWSSTQPQ